MHPRKFENLRSQLQLSWSDDFSAKLPLPDCQCTAQNSKRICCAQSLWSTRLYVLWHLFGFLSLIHDREKFSDFAKECSVESSNFVLYNGISNLNICICVVKYLQLFVVNLFLSNTYIQCSQKIAFSYKKFNHHVFGITTWPINQFNHAHKYFSIFYIYSDLQSFSLWNW